MKGKILKVVSVLAYYCGAVALFYWLNRKAKRILTFHNVLPDELYCPGIANGVSNRLSDFEKIIDECAKRFKFSTDLFDASTLTITFDDGYRNQYSTAFRSLHKRGIPAYLFVAGDCFEGRALTVDLLTHWIDNVPAGNYVLEIVGGGQKCEISETSRLSVWTKIIWPMFIADVKHKGTSVLKACDKAYSIEEIVAALPEEYRKERFDGVTREECDEMRKAGWKIGWHTKSHYPLTMLGKAELKYELDSPPEFRQVCLSYPYGNPVEVGKMAIKIAEEFGYPYAVSNTNEVAPFKFFLPRMSISSEKYRAHLQLSGVEYFIKHKRLLPRYDISKIGATHDANI